MFLIGVIYPAENIFYSRHVPVHLQDTLYHAYLLVPIAWIINAFKQMFFGPQSIVVSGVRITTAHFDIRYGLIALVTSSLICVYGYHVFNRAKWRFTERS
jgi:hypothetical protein